MTSLEDKANSGGGPEVLLASGDASGVYRLQDVELTSHEDIRDADGFPHYGEFLEVLTVRARSDRDSFYDQESAWLECPASLADELWTKSVNVGDVFALGEPTKGPGDNWQFIVQTPDEPQDLL